MSEAVNHPQHYQKEGRKECIKEMEEKFGVYETCIFALISAYKYLYRAGEKEGNTKQQDVEKAKWYIAYANTYQELFSNGSIYSVNYHRLLYIVEEELANVES